MQARHPEMTPDAMHEAAMQAVHANAAHADVLGRESAQLAIKAGRRAMKREEFKAIAEGIIASENHRDVNHDSYVKAEQKYHRAAADELLKTAPDYTMAFQLNQRAELAHACYRAASEAEDMVADMGKLMQRVGKTEIQKRVGLAGGYMVTAKDGTYMMTMSPEEAASFAKEKEGTTESFLKAIQRMEDVWSDKPTRYDLTTGAVSDMHDQARSLMHMADLAHKVRVAGEAEELSEVVADLTDSQAEAAKGGRVVVPRRKGNPYQFRTWLRQFDAGNRTIAGICRSLDDEKANGYHWNTINRPLNDAANNETVRKIANMKETKDAFDVWGKRGQRGNVYIPEIDEHLDLETRIGVALYSGSVHGMERMATRDGWDANKVRAIVGTLDKDDLKLVKTIWANLEKKWPEISEVHQRINGIPPDKSPTIPVQTKFGTIDGGYYPIVYDKDVGSRAFELTLQKPRESMTGNPKAGFAISRVDTTGLKLQYGFDALFRHNDETAHYLSHAETAQNLNKIINNRNFSQSVIDRFGRPTYEALAERIKNVLEGPRGPQNSF